jgi:23S rRNA pseudouridine1911/1915/1917 synthase
MGLKTTIKNDCTLLEILQEFYPQSPRTRIKKILQHDNVMCNGKVVTLHSFRLKPGDVVEVKGSSGTPNRAVAPFPVLYEDQDIIVVDKPVGISTSSVDNSPNVYNILSQYLKNQSKGRIKAYVVHRLDKEVSGVLLFAKSEKTMNIIKDNWKETEKLYFALVEGGPESPEGTIESWLVEDKNLKVHSTRMPSEKTKFAITHYRTIKRLDRHTLLEVNIETGRKNQIRVHMSDLGCPIVGDRKYGASTDFVRRVRLHAFCLSFPHPVTKEIITVESPLPKDFLVLKDRNEVYK